MLHVGMDQPLLILRPSPVVLYPLNPLRMRRLDRGLQCRVVPPWNVYRTWAGRPDLLGHDKGWHEPSAVDRPGMTGQFVAGLDVA